MKLLMIGIGAILGFLAVALGAFAAHGLKARLAADMLAIFETGVRYQMYHALAILMIGVLGVSRRSSLLDAAGYAMIAGIAVFSGSLYLLSLTDTRWLGAITPIGGLAFLAGWVLLAVAAFKM